MFGPYEVYERLGVGGMATVHRAKERGIEGFERVVALKRLLPHLAEDASFVRSFVREAKLASLLRHANIVQMYELGRVGAVYFISMELIEGRDIRRILRQARRVTGPPPLSVFISLMTQLCDALHYAHTRVDDKGEPLGIVHRDVSPSNLIITDSGHLKIIDFGIAKAQTEQLRTQTGRIKGKLAYMAPEAIRGYELDSRSDIWAAGVIAHELLTARPLFATKNEYQTLMRVQSAEIEPPSKYNENCPSELDDVVLMALAREPAERWPSAAEFRHGLEYVRSQYQVSATPSEVAEWMKWAFSQGQASATSSFDTVGSSSHSVTPSQMSAPARAFARARSRAAGHTGTMPALEEADVDAAPAAEPAEASEGPALRASQSRLMPPRSQPVQAQPPASAEAFAFEDSKPGEEEEEEAATYAWGAKDDDDGKPLLLDDVPEVSHRASVHNLAEAAAAAVSVPAPVSEPAVSAPAEAPTPAAARAPSAPSAGFGAGIVAQGDDRKRTGLIAGVSILAAMAGVLVYFLAIRSPAKPTSTAEQRPETGTLRFRVEPADATISVLGYGKHTGVPYELEVDAPGIYSIEIAREGYKTYVTELDVEAGVKQTLAVALQTRGGSDKAQVKLESTPPGKRIFLDGQDTGQRTPYMIEMTPGKHQLGLRDDNGSELWTHEFEADLDKQYVFSPSVANLEQRALLEKEKDERENGRSRRAERSTDRRKSTRGSSAASTVSEVVQANGEHPISDSASGLGSMAKIPGMSTLAKTVDTEPSKTTEPGKTTGEAKPTEAAKTDVPQTTVPPEPKQPEVVVEKTRPAKVDPVNIPPNKAKKISGEPPMLTLTRRDTAKAVSAKLCIDTSGKVTSVQVLNKLSSRPTSEVESGLRSWRYKPYVQGGQKVPACFVVSFRVTKK